MKSLRPPPSDKQKQHTARLVEMNRQKWQEKTEQKMKKIEEEQKEKDLTHQKVVVKPKRVYKNVLVKKMQPAKPEEIEYIEQVDDEEEEEEEEEIIEQVVRRPKKKIIRKVIEESSEDDEIIQKTKKASKIVDAVSKLDNAIQGLKQNNNKYSGMLSGIKF